MEKAIKDFFSHPEINEMIQNYKYIPVDDRHGKIEISTPDNRITWQVNVQEKDNEVYLVYAARSVKLTPVNLLEYLLSFACKMLLELTEESI